MRGPARVTLFGPEETLPYLVPFDLVSCRSILVSRRLATTILHHNHFSHDSNSRQLNEGRLYLEPT